MAAKVMACIYDCSCKVLTLLVVFYAVLTGLAVNGQRIVKPLEDSSSQRSVTATKGSSVWLHWNYTYVGDGTHDGIIRSIFKEQIIGFNSTSQASIQALAKRIGQNGKLKLESPVPAPFNGRVEVIESNSTLVIHDLHYNDSSHQLSSIVQVDIDLGGITRTNEISLKPIVSLTIVGIPDFITQPPATFDIYEGSSLQMKIEMDGNPRPSANFRWPHLIGSSPIYVSSLHMRPFVYSSTYILKNLDGTYCGRILTTTINNAIGKETKSTRVNVMLKLQHRLDLKARKLAASKCVDLEWNKAESGACDVKYEAVFVDAAGNILNTGFGYNIGKMKNCNLTVYKKVVNVQLTVSFMAVSKNITERVSSQTPINTPALTTTERTSETGNQHSDISLLHTTSASSENPMSTPNNGTTIKGLAYDIILGLVGSIVALRIMFIVVDWCIKLTTTSISIPIRSTRSSTTDVRLDFPAR